MNRAEAERQGRRGERQAALWLWLKGWRVLARRQKIGAGEIDLIARKGRTVAFIEVKWRSTGAALDHAIDARRLKRVARAAEALAPRFAKPGDDVRIDVILIAPGQWPRQIANVWQPGA